MKSRIVLTLAAASAVAPSIATAELGPIVVTASRTEEAPSQTLAATSIIDRQEIEHSQSRQIIDLLAGRAGIDYNSNGGYGKATSLYLRGTAADHVLVLVDGIRTGSVTDGTAALQHLPLEEVERIEVVRGPRSSLYGSEAIGGVIQVFTRRGEPGLQGWASAGVGEQDSRKASAGLSGGNGDTTFSIQGSRFRTDGIDAQVANNPDEDGYFNKALNLGIEHRFGEEGRASFRLLRSQGNTEYDGTDPTADYDQDFLEQTATAEIEFSPVHAWETTLRLGENRSETDDFTNGKPTTDWFGNPSSRFRSRRTEASWQNDLAVAQDHLLTLGADFTRDRFDGDPDYAETERDNTGLFLQHQAELGRNRITLGLRQDDNEAFGNHTTGHLNWGYRLGNGWRVTAGHGTAFKAPTFNDLYWPNSGNPDLGPETSRSTEAGLHWDRGVTSWSLHAYHTEVDDLINWVPGPAGWRPENVSEAEIEGLEASLTSRWAGWHYAVNLTLTNPKDTEDDKWLTHRTRRSARLDLGRDWGRWRTDLTWLLQGPRYEDTANSEKLGGYGRVDVAVGYELAPQWDARARVDNLLDKDYRTAADYNTLGRTAFFEVRYRSE